jgi:hypothetical protein
MATDKAKSLPESERSQRPDSNENDEPEIRPESHTRVRPPRQRNEGPRAYSPSTLPPPPFESETAVPRLEWWLDAHMALASQILWLRHLLGAVTPGDAHTETVKLLVRQTESVRDALYELYCDAADDRIAPLVKRGGILEAHVRASYAWCVLVVRLLASITTDLRRPAGPDWSAVRRGSRQISSSFPSSSPGLREAIDDLPIDFTSPVEPLRNLGSDIDQLLAATGSLGDSLTKRLT